MQVMLMKLMSKSEYLIAPKGTKFMGSGKLGLSLIDAWYCCFVLEQPVSASYRLL